MSWYSLNGSASRCGLRSSGRRELPSVPRRTPAVDDHARDAKPTLGCLSPGFAPYGLGGDFQIVHVEGLAHANTSCLP
jgi:hypothetical protein